MVVKFWSQIENYNDLRKNSKKYENGLAAAELNHGPAREVFSAVGEHKFREPIRSRPERQSCALRNVIRSLALNHSCCFKPTL